MKHNGNGFGNIFGVLVGIFVSLCVMVLIVSIAASMVLKGKMNLRAGWLSIGVCHYVVALIGCLIGGTVAGKKIVGCIGTMAGNYFMYITMGVAFFDSAFSNIVAPILSGVAGGLTALFLLTKIRKTGKRKLPKMAHR